MTKPLFNPAKCLREWNPANSALLTAKLQIVTGPGRVTASDLRNQNARHFAMLPSDTVTAKLWAMNLEMTRRGIAPRWRGIDNFNPSAVSHAQVDYGLSDSVPRLISAQVQRKLLLRWVDLEWLHQELGPSHFPNNLAWRRMFIDNIDQSERERLFARVAESDDKPHRIVDGLSVTDPYMLALKGFGVAAAGDRCKVVRRRLKDVVEPRLEALARRPRYRPTPDALATRLMYAEAIELARGSPTETARFVRWISGDVVKPQAAHQMRNKIAADLKLKGRAWR